MGARKSNSNSNNQSNNVIDFQARKSVSKTNKKVDDLGSKLDRLEKNQKILIKGFKVIKDKLSQKDKQTISITQALSTVTIATAIIIFAISFLIDRSENYLREGIRDLKKDINRLELRIDSITEGRSPSSMVNPGIDEKTHLLELEKQVQEAQGK